MKQLQPVRGTVKWQGGKPLTGGTVELVPADANFGAAAGDISPEGTYQIYTFLNGQRHDGAMPGTYHVSVIPPGQGDRFVEPIDLGLTITVTEGQNEVPLEVPPMGR